MSLRSWILGLRSAPSGKSVRHRRASRALQVEPLEDRALMNATLSISDAFVEEGTFGTTYMTFTVQLSEPSAGTVTVNYATADGTAKAKGRNGDYQAAIGTLTFAPGETTKTISVAINGDKRTEYEDYFTVNLSAAAGAEIGDGQGTGFIVNDDTKDHDQQCPHHYCLP
jgi:chitinase